MSAAESNFYWPMRLLPAARREAAFAVYAFCRAVDDIADGDGPVEARRDELQKRRAEIAALYDGVAGDACTDGNVVADSPLARAVRRYDLPRDAFDAVIDGMAVDLDGPVVAPDAAALELYCARVAGAVGRLLVRIFADDRRPDDDRFAVALGEALQLTNILRDVAEDARCGRLYLPREALDAAGIAVRDPAAVLRHPRLSVACGRVAASAEARYAEAAALLPAVGRRRMWAAAAMMTVYRRVLAQVLTKAQAHGWGADGPKPRPARWTAAWLTLRAACGRPAGLS